MAKEYSLPKLPYEFHELEPVISAKIMEIHYTKHHAGYVKNLNIALQKLDEAQATQDLCAQIKIQGTVAFNGGGHLNHSFFWESLSPQSRGGGVLQEGELKKSIIAAYGSVDHCIELLTAACNGIQGSGWGWLGYCTAGNHLQISTTQNHDLLSSKGPVPLLCIDVWEHAYYLQYANARAEYLKQIWSIINWKKAEERFLQTKQTEAL